MKTCYLKLFIIVIICMQVVSTEQSTCSTVLGKECGSYCLKIVRPLLNYAADVKSKEQQFAELQSKIQDQAAFIRNLNDALQHKELLLTTKEDVIQGLNSNIILLPYLQSDIQTKDIKINEADKTIRNKNDIISNLQSELQSKDKKINDKVQLILDKENQIFNLQLEIESKNVQISEKDKVIKGKDDIIFNLQSEVKSKELKIIEKDNESKENAANIKKLEADLLDYHKMIASSNCLGKLTDVYTIKVPNLKPFSVFCDSTLVGSGWTVIQRRINGSENFNRNWDDYKAGFGDLRGEFFIGLEKLKLLTQWQPHELYIYLEDFQNNTAYAQYSNFLIGNEEESYELKLLGNYSGNTRDSLTNHINMKFSTPDRGNPYNCAKDYKSGWWFKKCYLCNLNGIYDPKATEANQPGIKWNGWKLHSLKFVQMMIKPKIL